MEGGKSGDAFEPFAMDGEEACESSDSVADGSGVSWVDKGGISAAAPVEVSCIALSLIDLLLSPGKLGKYPPPFEFERSALGGTRGETSVPVGIW